MFFNVVFSSMCVYVLLCFFLSICYFCEFSNYGEIWNFENSFHTQKKKQSFFYDLKWVIRFGPELLPPNDSTKFIITRGLFDSSIILFGLLRIYKEIQFWGDKKYTKLGRISRRAVQNHF